MYTNLNKSILKEFLHTPKDFLNSYDLILYPVLKTRVMINKHTTKKTIIAINEIKIFTSD